MQRIDQVLIPEGANKPRFIKFDPAQFPIIQLSLRHQVRCRYSVIAEQLELELRRTKGVASVTVSGKLTEEVQITLDTRKLEEMDSHKQISFR